MPHLNICFKDLFPLVSAVTCFFFSSLTMGQHQITVTVADVKNSDGKVSAALYDTADTFLKFDDVFASTSSKAEVGNTILIFDDIPQGTYGIALYHDENDNGEMDTNWMGIPKEKVAFSKAKMRAFGPPKFNDCAFLVNQDVDIKISF